MVKPLRNVYIICSFLFRHERFLMLNMNEKINLMKLKYKNNPGWAWLLATLFLFPILPEYISPFILFIGFIVFKRQWTREGRKAKVGTLGKLQMMFMTLALVSVLWSDTKLDTLGTAGLWWGMFLIQVMIYNLANTREKIDNILKVITVSAGINGILGTIQILTHLFNKMGYISKSLVVVTPFYRDIDKAVYTWLPFEIRTNTFSDRASGFFSNPNLLATYMVFTYPISIYLFLNAKTKKDKLFYFLMNVFISAGISSTMTRAGCVIALFGWIFMFIILAKRHARELFEIFLPTVSIIVPSILARYGLAFTIKKSGIAKLIIRLAIARINTAILATLNPIDCFFSTNTYTSGIAVSFSFQCCHVKYHTMFPGILLVSGDFHFSFSQSFSTIGLVFRLFSFVKEGL